MKPVKFTIRMASKGTEWLLSILVILYRLFISPILHLLAPGSGCRFEPTCSDYALQAIRKHGPGKGSWLAIKRLAKCHPWGSYGFDPVPEGCSCTKASDHQHASPFEHSSTQGDSVRGN